MLHAHRSRANIEASCIEHAKGMLAITALRLWHPAILTPFSFVDRKH